MTCFANNLPPNFVNEIGSLFHIATANLNRVFLGSVTDQFISGEYINKGVASIPKRCLKSAGPLPSIERPKLIILDTMNFWMDNCLEDLMEALKDVDVLTINDEEARQLSGEYSLVKAARKILSFGPKHLIIKKGEHGALLFNNEEVFFAPALPLEEVFDPTGAGDTFAGGFVGHLCATKDYSFHNMKRAVIFGSAMASFCVEKFGTARLEALTDEAVKQRIQEFVKLVRFDV